MASSASATVRAKAALQMTNLPLRFEANAGQWDPRVRFRARQAGATLFLTDEGMTISLHDEKPADAMRSATPDEQRLARDEARRESKSSAITMRLVGARRSAPRGENELATRSNFFLGTDASKWRTQVANYQQVRAKGWVHGVDVVWHGGERGPEYDLDVDKGIDASKIEIRISGAKAIKTAKDGSLEMATEAGRLVQKPPRVLQSGHLLAAHYQLVAPDRVRFAIDGYDAREPVLIDPVLSYSTYLGGTGDDVVSRVAVDANGSAYVVGTTQSTDFPEANALQGTYGGGNGDAFVAKLDASGAGLAYATYLGGKAWEDGLSLAVDASGSAYVVGYTGSTNFPTVSALQATYGGASDAFLAKLSVDGATLLYSTYLGGGAFDAANGVAIDGGGNAYVAGYTQGSFPTANPIQGTFGGQAQLDAFLAKVNAAGSALVYSTYLGGGGLDVATGVTVDSGGAACIVGYTNGSFPLASAFQSTYGGGTYDAFAAKVNSAGSGLVYSTYLGGSDNDTAGGVAVDGSGNAYVVGATAGLFPTASPLQATNAGGGYDAFVAKLNAAGSALVYSTYLGGAAGDAANDIAVDAQGRAYVVGTTSSSAFPTTGAVQGTYGGGDFDAFFAELNAGGSALVYASYLGGSGTDQGRGVAVDAVGRVYAAGYTTGSFPTSAPFQGTYGGGADDAFVAKVVGGLGEPCTSGLGCSSGFCADAVCCDTACDAGGCDRCNASGNVGTCTIASAGFPGANPSCTVGYVCDGLSATCPSSCSTDAQCASGYYCAADGSCKAQTALGNACTLNVDCTSGGCRACATGHCVDGVCCDTACTGACRACAASLKQSGVADGTCGNAKGGIDPHDDCPASGTTCGADGLCDGAGACRLAAATNTACGPTTCAGTTVEGQLCNGDAQAPACIANPSGVDCAPFQCVSGTCTTACKTSADCAADGWCSAGTCVNRHGEGAPCSASDECGSNHCVDGVCCNSVCSGQCEACDVAGSEGTCTPAKGNPHGQRPTCNPGEPRNPCSAMTCDGSERNSCMAFPDATTNCGDATCVSGEEAVPGKCDGRGLCRAPDPVSCGAYACGASACKASCTSNADCIAPAQCDPSGKCASRAAEVGESGGCNSSGRRGGFGPWLALVFAGAIGSMVRRKRRA